MKATKQTFWIMTAVFILTGCDMIKNTFTYKDKTKEFIETLIKSDYNKCIDLFAMQNEMAKKTNIDSLKAGLDRFRKHIIRNWGPDLEYTFMKSQKFYSTDKHYKMPPNSTIVLIEIRNKKECGVVQVLFDDSSQKIMNIKTLDFKAPIPDMTFFWLFGLLAICIPIFNIYVIRQIKKSNLEKKWPKYIAVALINTPSISYFAVSGLSFQLINFQFLLGFSFAYMGTLNSFWTFGIPMGGFYWLWKLKQIKENTSEPEAGKDQGKNTEPTTENE